MKSTKTARTAVVMTAIVALFAASSSVMAKDHDKDTKWEKHHPRREQVNDRLANQNQRIKEEVKEGELTKAQANDLHKEDRQIRQEERAMASQNGGHITKAEQKVLNKQENAVSKQIGK
jgi:Asp-tRNA(Asn)/Glu-tRNA(Gln) amidotransferase A subunit family amidase